MTLDEFLDDYVPRVLKPLGGWTVNAGMIGRYGDRWQCPLSAGENRPAFDYYACALKLGISSEDRRAIAIGADRRGTSDIREEVAPVRLRLLRGLGLSEASR